ncbi:hypothetical protein GNI_080590, partial [Gregarina niphandrodes]
MEKLGVNQLRTQFLPQISPLPVEQNTSTKDEVPTTSTTQEAAGDGSLQDETVEGPTADGAPLVSYPVRTFDGEDSSNEETTDRPDVPNRAEESNVPIHADAGMPPTESFRTTDIPDADGLAEVREKPDVGKCADDDDEMEHEPVGGSAAGAGLSQHDTSTASAHPATATTQEPAEEGPSHGGAVEEPPADDKDAVCNVPSGSIDLPTTKADQDAYPPTRDLAVHESIVGAPDRDGEAERKLVDDSIPPTDLSSPVEQSTSTKDDTTTTTQEAAGEGSSHEETVEEPTTDGAPLASSSVQSFDGEGSSNEKGADRPDVQNRAEESDVPIHGDAGMPPTESFQATDIPDADGLAEVREKADVDKCADDGEMEHEPVGGLAAAAGLSE